MAPNKMKKIAVLCSGSGTNLQAIIDSVKSGFIKAKISLVLSDNKSAFALERAKRAGIETSVVEAKNFSDRISYDKEVVRILKEFKIDLVVLAGFMRILTSYFVENFKNRILNIHPALLPFFKGAHAIKDALKAGENVTGVTVHFVTASLDAGPIILQEAVRIEDSDTEGTLLERVHKVEHLIYPKVIKLFLEGKLAIKDNRVLIK